MTTRMILMRHGDTNYKWGVFAGSTDVGLRDGALERAREVGESLRKEGVQAIYTSQLKRAWKTAEAIGEVLGIKPVRFRELNESDFGKWEMKWQGDVEKENPGVMEKRRSDIWNYREHGGESASQVRDRALPVIEDLFRKNEGKTFLVVAHGLLIKIMYSTLLGIEMGSLYWKEMEPLGAFFFKKDGDKIEVERTWGVKDG